MGSLPAVLSAIGLAAAETAGEGRVPPRSAERAVKTKDRASPPHRQPLPATADNPHLQKTQ
jgi:hypothetical protein